MQQSIEEVQQRISSKYLGQAGIHSVASDRTENVIILYVDVNECGELPAEIEKDAQPYKLKVIRSPRANIY